MFTIYCSNTLHNQVNCSYPHACSIENAEDLKAAASHDFVCARYRNNHRSQNTFLESDCLAMDCDNEHSDNPEEWITPEDVAEAFPDVTFGVHYSRNHSRPKENKSARPRFHILFPIDKCTDAAEYKNLKLDVMKYFPYFDPNAMDSARFFFGTQNPEVAWFDGELNLSEFFFFISSRQKEIKEGERNTTMSRFAAKVLKRYGICEESRNAFMEMSQKCTPPLEDEELHSVWRSACRFYNQKVLSDPKYIQPAKYARSFPDESQVPELPDPIALSSIIDPPAKPPELICGILRQGHKMLIAGPSKAGKSFLLMELAIAIAQGSSWMGFPCRQGKVLYINLEIDPASCIDRFLKIYNTLGLQERRSDNILVWNLRGHALPLDRLAPILISKMLDEEITAVIVDPIYKVITGDENNATEMGAFCNQFDTICTALNASVIYCHHHSKGYQGNKKALDRASGSGVFARDPDAVIDIIALKKPASQEELEEEEESDEEEIIEKTPWQMEAALREFPPIRNIRFFFDHPLHVVDSQDLLKSYNAEGSGAANLSSSSKRTTKAQRRKRLDEAYAALSPQGPVTVSLAAEFLGLTKPTIRNYIKEFPEDYTCVNGVIQEAPILGKTPEN